MLAIVLWEVVKLLKRQDIIEAIKLAKVNSKPRKFVQAVDFTVNFAGIDFKKQENRIDVEVSLPHATGKSETKVLVFVKDKNFVPAIKDKADKIIMVDEIPSIKKKDLDLLMIEYPVFLAEGPAILIVGKYLGQMLAPKGRMPKPIQATAAAYGSAVSRFGSTTRITNKKGKFMPVVHIKIGNEKSKDEDLADNIEAIYKDLVAKLPNKHHNIKSTQVKLTMGKPAKLGEKLKGVPNQKPAKEAIKEETAEAKEEAKEETKETAEESK